MTENHPMIYHIVIESDFRAQLESPVYLPSSLHGHGFVHCAFEPSVIPVANDYYAAAPGRVLLLEIDPARLTSETRYEAAAPIAGGGSSHLASAAQFPHVYGPINKEAITGVGVLGRIVGGYEWPRSFMPLDSFLTADIIDDILAAYDWFDLSGGPKFVETHRDAHRTPVTGYSSPESSTRFTRCATTRNCG